MKHDEKRDQVLVGILIDHQVLNENGEILCDFVDQGRDTLDFASVYRGTLRDLMTAAYEAGKASK